MPACARPGDNLFTPASRFRHPKAAILLAMGFAAAAFGKRFRVYSIATMVLLVAFGALAGVAGPRIQANLPTPWVGVWQRLNIAVWMLWIVVLAVALLRRSAAAASSPLTAFAQRGTGGEVS